MQKQKLIELIEKIQCCECTQEEADHDINFLCSSVTDPQAASYIFQEDLNAEEIANKILDYKPIQL